MRRWLEPLLLGVPPAVVAAGWVDWARRIVDLQEKAIRPLSGLAYATFVQLCWSWNHGLGWTQTVHRGYAADWRWGGHYAPVLFLSAWVSGFSDSAWALARWQVTAVGLGILPAALLGAAEAGFMGAVAGIAIYAGSGSVALLALADYQDLVLCLPLLPLAVWAARHASATGFVVAAALLGATREELLVLLPFVGFSGGLRRAGLGLAVSGAYLLAYASLGPSPYPNPLADISAWQLGRGMVTHLGERPVEWNLYGTVAATALPWLFFAPATALAAAPVLLFHHQDPTSVHSLSSPAVHHFAPMLGVFVSAGIVGAGRALRVTGRLAPLVLLGVLASTGWSLRAWTPTLLALGVRVVEPGTSEVWTLLDAVPADGVLLVPESIAPAAACRARVVTPDSLGDRVPATSVDWGIDDGRFTGEIVQTRGRWRLLRHPRAPEGRTDEHVGGRQ